MNNVCASWDGCSVQHMVCSDWSYHHTDTFPPTLHAKLFFFDAPRSWITFQSWSEWAVWSRSWNDTCAEAAQMLTSIKHIKVSLYGICWPPDSGPKHRAAYTVTDRWLTPLEQWYSDTQADSFWAPLRRQQTTNTTLIVAAVWGV